MYSPFKGQATAQLQPVIAIEERRLQGLNAPIIQEKPATCEEGFTGGLMDFNVTDYEKLSYLVSDYISQLNICL